MRKVYQDKLLVSLLDWFLVDPHTRPRLLEHLGGETHVNMLNADWHPATATALHARAPQSGPRKIATQGSFVACEPRTC